MATVGFNFTKVLAHRKSGVKGKISINNNISVKKVEEHNLVMGKDKQPGLKFTFEFKSVYKPAIGEILLEGDLVFLDEEKKIKEVLAMWKKDKKVPEDIMKNLLNNVLNRCNIQALIMSQYANLPAPIPLPKVESK